jgi:hypothetical protein
MLCQDLGGSCAPPQGPSNKNLTVERFLQPRLLSTLPRAQPRPVIYHIPQPNLSPTSPLGKCQSPRTAVQLRCPNVHVSFGKGTSVV